jgi:Ca-activated chloride channel family protein
MIAFARFADSRCPLTMDHAHLIDAVNSTEIVSDRAEDGTAIGDAIALGVERLASLDRRADVRAKTPIKSKIIILLTDGESNVGDIEPPLAAEMARALGIKIYTIGAGSKNSVAPVPVQDPFGRTFIQQMPVSIDEDTLRAIAEASGGEYFRASDVASLADVYARIDRLERTEIEQRRYKDYLEMAVEPSTLRSWLRLPALVPMVLGLLALEILCAQTRWRTIP